METIVSVLHRWQGNHESFLETVPLLHLAGMEVQDIYEYLPDPRPLNTDEDNEYVLCVQKLDAHFRGEDNVPYESHVFRQLTPTKGETADMFMARLRKQARHCNFGPTLEENLRDELIEKLPYVELKKKLLEVVNITLEAAVDKVQKWEASREQASQMVMPSQEPGAGTHAVKERPGRGDKGKSSCFNCGKEGHFSESKNCPHRGRKCSKCRKYGHYASCCKGGRNLKPGKEGNTQQRGGRQQRHGKGKQANHVEGHCNESGEDDSFAFTIEEQSCTMSSSAEPVISVKIGGINRDVLIDSGSASNLISKDTLQELKYQGLKIELKPCLKRLYAYGGRELKIEGQFQTEVSVPKAKVVADFIVVESGRCLLGYSSATDLGILRVDLSGTLGTGDCNTVDGTFVGGLKAKYPSVFQGIGKLKDYQLKLHIDPSVTPVVQKMRRVPFSVKDKVTAKVNELLEKDIIEKVEGPTVWVSPVVVAPKPSGDIRLCVDMRRANEAIIRERLPIPTIDEVLESLNGSGVFSKLDLRWGFHQIELDPDSRDITAFTTHDGIFRYKRLSFGVNAAPEKYQHIITQSMAGLQGVSNIADDLIVHGRDTEEHDKNLHSVLQRLSEKQLTLNAKNCSFRMTKVVFMSLLLSKHGIGPTKEKIEQVSAQDPELQALRNCLIEGKWDNAPKQYLPVRNELTFIGHVIVRGTRIVIPQALRKRVVRLAHEGHQGVIKTKERLRTKVWWPAMDRGAEKRCECYGCLMVTENVPPPPLKSTPLANQPWEEAAVDLMGPLPSGEHLLVLIDYCRAWIEVDFIRTTSSKTIIHCLEAQFARHGLPKGLRTDNGSNLESKEVEDYLNEEGIDTVTQKLSLAKS
ncbi:Uncharacterized protein K02A2.6 [Stylophora pistillata]|uniref:Uncharacterized protein K02A2.6 n=1 Tax=Stylophora pistillata TaxID=50429 RepID=A0A2B4R8Z6_STYPI|nr:Uncharacterized protein K02A2.6 [Stylophora pistillata]